MKDWRNSIPSQAVKARLDAKTARIRAEFAHRPILAENLAHKDFVSMAKSMKFPEGATYVAALATVYGRV